MEPKEGTQAVRLGSEHAYLLSHSTYSCRLGLKSVILKSEVSEKLERGTEEVGRTS